MVFAAVLGWCLIAWWLGSAFGAPIAVFLTVLLVMFGVIPLLGTLVGQRRVRFDRPADAVRVRQLFRERVLCRLSEILAIQVVGDADRYELNLVLADRPRFNLAAVKTSQERKRLQKHAQQVAAFLKVPFVDQLEAMAVVEP